MEKILFINACVRPESRTRALAGCLLDCLGGECEEVNITDGRIKPLDALSLDARSEKIREGDFRVTHLRLQGSLQRRKRS